MMKSTRTSFSFFRIHMIYMLVKIFIFSYFLVPILLRLPLLKLLKVIEPKKEISEARHEKIQLIINLYEKISHTMRPAFSTVCLTKGITLYYFLRRQGSDLTLCFGMPRGYNVQHAAGHCWLEQDGKPFLEGREPHERYIEMYRFSKEGASPGRDSIAIKENMRWKMSAS